MILTVIKEPFVLEMEKQVLGKYIGKRGEKQMVLTRNNNIDLIKLYACICVVALHTIPKDLSAVTTTIYYLSGVAVPLFFMSSGYFLLNRGEISINIVFIKLLAFFALLCYGI